jgi:transcription initiation factor TFIID TATA-box-binding protein
MLKSQSIHTEEIKISNIVTTADLKQKINIEKLNNFPWGIYDQVSYNGICGYVKTPEMKGKVTIFATGKMISIGSNTIEDSIDKLYQTKFYLLKEKLVKDVQLLPQVRNIVATISLDKSLNLKKLVKNIPNSIYEPDVFVALRYKIKEGQSALIFSSGKIVIAGGKSIQEIMDGYNLIKKYLVEGKKNNSLTMKK